MTDLDRSEHPAVARVVAAFEDARIRVTIRHLPDAVRTAQAAADALGITPSEIANSLVFKGFHDDGTIEPVLVLASGGHRVDTVRVAEQLELERLERADAMYVRERTGFAIGGVAPVGHLHPVRTVVDVDLARFETVWAAAGHSHSVLATTYDELLRVTGGTAMEVS
jgi:prolyl-tRNA editing enzyme YbaK/EbsC (Cys-tRNA(Pro) deacylase)